MNLKPEMSERLDKAADAISNAREWKKVARAAMKDAKSLAKLQRKDEPSFDLETFIEEYKAEKESETSIEETADEPTDDKQPKNGGKN